MTKLRTDGCPQISRRMLLVGGVAAGSAPLLAATDANANVKLSKAAVRFRTVAQDGKTCGACKLYRDPSSCTFVEGVTDPSCTCWIWRAKTA
ncbi:hypothetical protein GJ654_03390 [Rhodoblastus acidophilus]|uniref:High-potential iron-sulfur protein n=1 Tax=Rhodoblastus acidophilus TaxID=1074 RepID=A0A6N8DMM5_RHOAC|nr:hypothetical protein [Rhodoblastus acidophilus]MCW2273137.1 hypothetical protein [Rhodoblastus acidophilus]MTV30034.1 hypothetical protein [Rhodoblastus acidophilus]